MEFKTERKGKKTLKNAIDTRKTVTFSISNRDLDNIERLSETLHYSRSSIISALLEIASDPQNPQGFNELVQFFTDYDIARGQNVKKNKVSFNPSATSQLLPTDDQIVGKSHCEQSTKFQSKYDYNSTNNKIVNTMGIMRSDVSARPDGDNGNAFALVHDTTGKAIKVALSTTSVISYASIDIKTYRTLFAGFYLPSVEEIRRIAQGLISGEFLAVTKTDALGFPSIVSIVTKDGGKLEAPSASDGGTGVMEIANADDTVSDEEFNELMKELYAPDEKGAHQ